MSDLAAYQDFSAKARCANSAQVRCVLHELGARFVGTDHQRDTYYATEYGKLKLREGTLEHLLIHYERRSDASGTEHTRVYRYDHHPTSTQVAAVVAGRPVLGVVEKTRAIYFLGTIKIHLDTFLNGEEFVEVEAIDQEGRYLPEELRQQCLAVLFRFGLTEKDLLTNGYLPG